MALLNLIVRKPFVELNVTLPKVDACPIHFPPPFSPGQVLAPPQHPLRDLGRVNLQQITHQLSDRRLTINSYIIKSATPPNRAVVTRGLRDILSDHQSQFLSLYRYVSNLRGRKTKTPSVMAPESAADFRNALYILVGLSGMFSGGFERYKAFNVRKRIMDGYRTYRNRPRPVSLWM